MRAVPRRSALHRACGPALAAAAALLLACPALAAAGEYEVTNGADSGAGSFRAALLAANEADDFDRIRFTGPHRVVTSGSLTVAGPVAIDGAGGKLVGGDLLVVEPFVTVSRLGVAPPHRISAASPAPPADLRVHRGSDNGVRVSGRVVAAGIVESFGGGGEDFLARHPDAAGPGPFSVALPVEPAPGSRLTLTLTTSEGTSGFAEPVAVPGDLTAPRVTDARTTDADGDGRVDAVRVATSKPLDDGSGYGGLVLEGAPFAAATTGPGRDDEKLDAVLSSPQPGDARPLVRVAANTTLADPNGNQVLVMSEPVRAHDGVAPEVAAAVAVTRAAVRLRFTEPVTARSIQPADFTLSMGGEARVVASAAIAADGRSAQLAADRPWPHGTAGILRVKGALADAAGNVSSGERSVRVWAAPGDAARPVLRRVRLLQRVVCVKRVSRTCRRSGGAVAFTVDEPATIVLVLRRRGSDAPSTLKVPRSEGPGTVAFKEKIEGRRLRPGRYRLTVTAVDAAGNESRSRVLSLRVRR